MSVMSEIKSLREALTASRRDRINARVSKPEELDPTPLEVPVGHQGPPSMREIVQSYVRESLSQQAAEADFGTFEEEDDFEEEDGAALLDLSGYEVVEYPMEEEDPQPDAAPPEAPADPESGPALETKPEAVNTQEPLT